MRLRRVVEFPHGFRPACFRHMLSRRYGVVVRHIHLHDLERAGRAFAHAVAEAVAELLLDQLRLAADQLQRALGAGRDACAAAVAEVFVDLYDFAFHSRPGCWSTGVMECWEDTPHYPAFPRHSARSFSTVEIGMMLNFSTSTLSTFGVTNAGRLGPSRMFLIPR